MGRIWAGRLYTQFRTEELGSEAALGHILLVSMNPDAPSYAKDLDGDLLRSWADDGRWEAIFSNQQRIGTEDKPKPSATADADRTELARAAQMASLMTESAFADASGEDATNSDMQRWRETQKLWMQTTEQLRAYDEKISAKQLEETRAAEVRIRRTEIVDALSEQYGQLGPQYKILVDRLAGVESYLRVMEEAAVIDNVDRYLELSKTSVNLVNQLQKYTEATKLPQLQSAREEGAAIVLRLLEVHLAPSQPQLYQRIVGEIVGAIGDDPEIVEGQLALS